MDFRLKQIAEQASLEAIYQMDQSGRVLSASNYDKPHSFVGKSYGFRPYFEVAMNGQRGEFFGVGATTGRPGYFVSEPVRNDDGQILGVIAIKLDMSDFQSAWEESAERVFVSNADGVIVLSSIRQWLYHLLAPLDNQQLDLIRSGRQFGNVTLEKLDWEQHSSDEASLDGNRFIYVSNEAERLGWTVHYLQDQSRVFERATLTTVIFGVTIICLVLFATFLRSRRIETALQNSQLDKENLQSANLKLQAAQTELQQTSKLAALGQLSASVTHELGQPLSALRNYLTAIELSGTLKDGDMQSKLARVTERMENITRQLRFFIRSDQEGFAQIDVRSILSGAIELIEHQSQLENIELIQSYPEKPVYIMGHKLRLEQVFVNLFSNALSAVSDDGSGQIVVSIESDDEAISITVQDNGDGFGGRTLDTLLEPFHTTKASGDGLGLGLSIASEIIREHNGNITAQSREQGGAIFAVSLPAITSLDK